MAYRLINTTSLGGLSESLLAELEALPPVPGERDLKQTRLKFITELILSRSFNRCEWGSCHCKETNKTYRVNGQHSSTILRSVLDGEIDDAEFPAGVPVVMAKYECDTLVDLADVFNEFDNHRSSRSADDKLGIYIAQHQDLVGIDKKLISKICAGVDCARKQKVEEAVVLLEGINCPEAHERGRYLNIDQVREFIDLLHEFGDAPFKEWEAKTGIIARLFVLFLDDPESCSLAVEQTFFEAGVECSEYTKQVRNACSRQGKDQGWFYRITDKHIRKLRRTWERVGKDEIKRLIREVQAEDEADEVPAESAPSA